MTLYLTIFNKYKTNPNPKMQSLCAEMASELRFALRCGSQQRRVTKRRSQEGDITTGVTCTRCSPPPTSLLRSRRCFSHEETTYMPTIDIPRLNAGSWCAADDRDEEIIELRSSGDVPWRGEHLAQASLSPSPSTATATATTAAAAAAPPPPPSSGSVTTASADTTTTTVCVQGNTNNAHTSLSLPLTYSQSQPFAQTPTATTTEAEESLIGHQFRPRR